MSDISIKSSVNSTSTYISGNFEDSKASRSVEDNERYSSYAPAFGTEKDQVQKSSEESKLNPKAQDEEDTEEKKVQPEEKELSKALQELNEKMAEERANDLNRQHIGLNFSIDKDSSDTIVKVTDLNTEKLVRQIPSEEFLEFAKKLDEMRAQNQTSGSGLKSEAIGLLLDEQV